MRYRHLAILVATLLSVRHLILKLNATGTSFYHLLRQQIGRLFVTKPGIDICNDWHYVGFEIINFRLNVVDCVVIASLSSGVLCVEHLAEHARIGLPQKGVEFFDQR